MSNFRIFVSSPGDVGEERRLAGRVIDRLQREFESSVTLQAIFWEHEPLRATASFQEQIVRPSETDVVVCILWARIGTRLPPHLTRPDGSRYESGTAFEFEDALTSYRQKRIPDLLVYRKTARPSTELDSEERVLERLSQKKALDQFIKKWFESEDGSFIAAFHPFETPAQFEDAFELHLRKLIELRLAQQAPRPAETVQPVRWHRGSPYRGLEVFDIEHSPIYCGRTDAVSTLLEALRRQAADSRAFVLVTGMSGCGKSSLVRAGLLASLCHPGVVEGIGLWRTAVFRPADSPNPVGSLAAALLSDPALPELKASVSDASELTALLLESPKAVVPLVKTALTRAAETVQRAEQLPDPPAARLGVLIDQLEEIFTNETVTDAERERFVAAISALARSGVVWVVATLRSDLYGRASQIRELTELKEGSGQFDLQPPTAAEVSQIVRQPARMAGLRFEERADTHEQLDDVLRDAATRHPEALPLLEFTLEELYRRAGPDRLLTFQAYDEIGGVEGALARRAEEVYLALGPDAQAALPEILTALVSVSLGSDQGAARRRAAYDAVATTPGAQGLVRAFVESRLFVTDRDQHGHPVVSVAHEALLRHWPRLRDWIDQNAGMLRAKARLSAATALWVEQARLDSLLLPEGAPLTDAQKLVARSRASLSDDERAYVAASTARAKGTRQGRLRRRIAAAAAALLVLGAAAGYAELYVLPEVAYFKGEVLRNGLPEGIRPLTAAQASHVKEVIEIRRKGRLGPVIERRILNGSLQCPPEHSYQTFLGDAYERDYTSRRECRWVFVRDSEGNITREVAYDRMGREVYRFEYSGGGTTGSYISSGAADDVESLQTGLAMSMGSAATHVRLIRFRDGPSAGLVREERYIDQQGRPKPDQEGSYGWRYSYRPDGLREKGTCLGEDGRPTRFKDGYFSYQNTYDEHLNRIETTYLDGNDRPTPARTGVTRIKTTYDEWGNVLTVRFFDDQDRPVRHLQDGNSGYRHTYDEHGNQTLTVYFDRTDKLVRITNGYAGVKREFLPDGQLKSVTYTDENQRPVVRSDFGYARIEYAYDKDGNRTEERVFNAALKPTKSEFGVSHVVMKYDERGRKTATRYYDESGRPVANKEGFAGLLVEYNKAGKLTSQTYLNERGEPTDTPSRGIAIIRKEYNALNKVSRERYFNAAGKLTEDKFGIASSEFDYDERGNATEGRFYDAQGRLTNAGWGLGRVVKQYDDRGNELSTQYFDKNSQPAERDGVHKIATLYTGSNAVQRKSYFNKRNELVPGPDGYAELRAAFNTRGTVTERLYFGAGGTPMLIKGVHREAFTYDNAGNLIEEAFFDTTGQPAVRTGDYARSRMEYGSNGVMRSKITYDQTGQPATETYYGPGGIRTSSKLRTARGLEASEYDAQGRPAATTVFGADGKPTGRVKYENGLPIEVTHLGPDGRLVKGKDGFAIQRTKYNAAGKPIEESYYDENGRPVANIYDNQRIVTHYGRENVALERDFFHADGSRRTVTLNEQGDPVEETFYDAKGKATVDANGNVRIVNRYEAPGRRIGRDFFDVTGRKESLKLFPSYPSLREWTWYSAQGERVTNDAGAGAEKETLDANGRLIDEQTLDFEGKPLVTKLGYWRISRTYDDAGNVTGSTFYGEGNRPVQVEVFVTRVTEGTQAARVGLQAGDVLVSYAGQRIRWVPQLVPMTQTGPPGKRTLEVRRNGKPLRFELEPGRIGIAMAERKK
jgi:hypothetical protein